MNGYAYDESNRRRWWLIAGAALAAVALLAVGFGAGRVSVPSGSGSATQTVRVQSGPGPTHVVNGVPVGYAHTQAGAVAAATNYLETFNGPLALQPDKYRAAVNEMAAPDARVKLTALANNNMTGQQNLISYAAQGRTVIDRLVPLAYSVSRYNDSSVQISIWAETFIAVDSVLPLRDGWTTTTLTCDWVNDDWRLSDFPVSPGPESFGPVPIPIQAPGQGTALPPQLGTYRSYQLSAT
jgi:hypothetical protein